jgi:predicted transcriptional regulator
MIYNHIVNTCIVVPGDYFMSGQLYANIEERRDKLQIYYDILKVTTRPTKITRILRLANVQYNTFQECIDKLIKAGLLEKIHLTGRRNRSSKDARSKTTYKATNQGLDWCNSVEEIYQTLESN